jgi:hypothetical protein
MDTKPIKRQPEPKRRLFACVGGRGQGVEYRLYEQAARQLWESVEIVEALASALPDGAEADAASAARSALAELLYAMAEGRTVGRAAGGVDTGAPAGNHDLAVASLVSRQLTRRVARPRGIDGKAAGAGPH